MNANTTREIFRASSLPRRISRGLGPALLAIVAAAPLAAADPLSFIPGDLAVTYSVYPGLTNPFTGSAGGYTSPNLIAGSTVSADNPAGDRHCRR